MSKILKITYGGKDYELEYTRRTVVEMERKGFIVSEIVDKPMTSIPALFAGAFLAHHRGISRNLIDEIYSNLAKKDELINKLAELYNEPIMTLVDGEGESEGNADWTANW
jgi:hypothetical protein